MLLYTHLYMKSYYTHIFDRVDFQSRFDFIKSKVYFYQNFDNNSESERGTVVFDGSVLVTVQSPVGTEQLGGYSRLSQRAKARFGGCEASHSSA